jgi:hypothetical protein
MSFKSVTDGFRRELEASLHRVVYYSYQRFEKKMTVPAQSSFGAKEMLGGRLSSLITFF